MKNSFKIATLSLLFPIFSYGSQFSGLTKIKSVDNSQSGVTVIEFESLDRGNFATLPSNISKIKFDYLKWPKESRNNSILEKLMFWKPKPQYSKEEFDKCISWMLENHKNGKNFQLGQIGGGNFEFSEGAAIAPYLHFQTTDDGKEQVCLIDLG